MLVIVVEWQINRHGPKEHENEVSNTSPSGMNDLQPGMCIRGVELELGTQLMQQPVRVRI